jgi:toxin CcdB
VSVAVLDHGPLRRLTSTFGVNGTGHAMLTPQLAGMSVRQLGPTVADLNAQRDEILAAPEMVFTGF